MKKTLYATTALAAAGLLTLGASDAFAQAAAPAKPEKLKMAIGGFFHAFAGYADQSGSFEDATGNHYGGFDIKNDSEIKFSGSVPLDNGMKVSLQVEFETDTANAGGGSSSDSLFGLDESWLGLDTGGFGEVRVGTQKQVNLTLHTGAPNSGGMNPANGDTTEWIVKPAGIVGNGFPAGGNPSGSDQMRITYISPVLAGFRFGAGYQPSTVDQDDQPLVGGDNGNTEAQTAEAAIQYATTLGPVGLRASVGYLSQEGTIAQASNTINPGLELRFGDVTVGAGYRHVWGSVADRSFNPGTNSANADGVSAGIAYAPGPWKIGFRTSHTWLEGARADSDDDKVTLYKLGANYTLGPGVELTGDLFHLEYEDEGDNPANSNKGWALVGGIAVAF